MREINRKQKDPRFTPRPGQFLKIGLWYLLLRSYCWRPAKKCKHKCGIEWVRTRTHLFKYLGTMGRQHSTEAASRFPPSREGSNLLTTVKKSKPHLFLRTCFSLIVCRDCARKRNFLKGIKKYSLQTLLKFLER